MNNDTNNALSLVDNNQTFHCSTFIITILSAETNDTGNQIQIILHIANENTSTPEQLFYRTTLGDCF